MKRQISYPRALQRWFGKAAHGCVSMYQHVYLMEYRRNTKWYDNRGISWTLLISMLGNLPSQESPSPQNQVGAPPQTLGLGGSETPAAQSKGCTGLFPEQKILSSPTPSPRPSPQSSHLDFHESCLTGLVHSPLPSTVHTHGEARLSTGARADPVLPLLRPTSTGGHCLENTIPLMSHGR